MVGFQELRITPDGKNLIIDVSVLDLPCYQDVYLDSIVIDTQDTFIENGPSSNPIFLYQTEDDVSSASNVYTASECNCNPIRDEEDNAECLTSPIYGEKRIRLILNEQSVGASLNNTLFFVYVVTKGTPNEDECDDSQPTIMTVVTNLYPFYRDAMNYVKEVEADCCIPKHFIDKILRFKAFDLCIRTGHYTQAIKYWNKFFKTIPNTGIHTGCGCDG